MTTYTAWPGYFYDHEIEDDQRGLTYKSARETVILALTAEADNAENEANNAETVEEHNEWLQVCFLYEAAIDLLSHASVGQVFDVGIRDERFAVVPD
jgi:hypothetical protein